MSDILGNYNLSEYHRLEENILTALDWLDDLPVVRGTRGVVTSVENADLDTWKHVVLKLRGGGVIREEIMKYLELPIEEFCIYIYETTGLTPGYPSSSIVWGELALNSLAWKYVKKLALEAGIHYIDDSNEPVYVYYTTSKRAFVWGGGLIGFTTLDREGSEFCFEFFSDYFLNNP